MSGIISPHALLDPSVTCIGLAGINEGFQIIDVRSLSEFNGGSLPGAVNIPLFDEDERSVVGTIYKHGGRENAIRQGLDFMEGKIGQFLQLFEPYREKPLAIICARGGMRSKSVVNLLRQFGFSAVQFEGGYKRYRNGVMAALDSFAPRLIVIHGFTGTGKTRILHYLENSIDLEAMARHRSSIFGALDQQPSTQRMFESLLAKRIGELREEPYFIEGESRKIGEVFIPKPLAMAMKRAVMVRVHCNMETRVKRIIEDYPVEDPEILARVDSILQGLKWHLGGELVEKMRLLLHNGDLEELVRLLLVEYYDRRYGKSMSGYTYALELSSEDLEGAAHQLTKFRERQLIFVKE